MEEEVVVVVVVVMDGEEAWPSPAISSSSSSPFCARLFSSGELLLVSRSKASCRMGSMATLLFGLGSRGAGRNSRVDARFVVSPTIFFTKPCIHLKFASLTDFLLQFGKSKSLTFAPKAHAHSANTRMAVLCVVAAACLICALDTAPGKQAASTLSKTTPSDAASKVVKLALTVELTNATSCAADGLATPPAPAAAFPS